MEQKQIKILAVCLGNICRSPICHGLLEHYAKQYDKDIIVDSAGTIGIHSGSPPDHRSIEIMKVYGHDISHQRSRKFHHYDFEEYDIILAMDRSNYLDLCSIAINEKEESKVHMVIDGMNVPDPYYGGDEGFENVYQMLDEAVQKWLNELVD
ncbi:MAG: protein-tyrosine-phosphatase [Crocinitomicaceae bacterium]|nr:protein-tyrosine-phosphatase [Crocinitomicaceae bacterium]|tara:strand:+ start:1381 stop:1836 length:456 start_codon:yes stop_codon:yes gene_type:complete